jgi:hypothetical protein
VLTPAGAIKGSLTGGTGKTHLAALAARELWRDEAVTLIVWVHAASRDAVIGAYAEALQAARGSLRGASPEQAADQFLAWLGRSTAPWLVVLDGLASAATLDGLWPSGAAGRVLVTAANPADAAGAPEARLMPVGLFSPREAMAFVSPHLHVDAGRRVGALELAGDLRFEPIALDMAVGVMAQLDIGCRDYQSRLAGEAAHRGGTGEDGRMAVLRPAWSVAAGVADRLSHPGLTSRALALLSVLSPAGVPEVVLASASAGEYLAGQQEGAVLLPALAGALGQLAGVGLVSVGHDDAASVLVHPVIQAITWTELAASERLLALDAAAQALTEAWSLPELPTAVDQLMRDCARSLSSLAGARLWVRGCHPVLLHAGHSLDRSGIQGSACEYWRDLLDASERALGVGDPQTAEIRDRFIAASTRAGRRRWRTSALRPPPPGRG